ATVASGWSANLVSLLADFGIRLSAMTFVVVATAFLMKNPGIAQTNWTPFIPPNTGHFGEFGWSGIARGAATIFFAYIGFDGVSTAAQEARNPQRDMPIGLLGSLAICTLLYLLVAATLTGVVHYSRLNVEIGRASCREGG